MLKWSCGCWIDGSAQHTCKDCKKKALLKDPLIKELIEDKVKFRLSELKELENGT